MTYHEKHRSHRISWLRAAVLGANDGIVSTSSLIIGFAAAHASQHDILLAGAAGLMAGAMSMAAGEYVSVSSQADTEKADLLQEQQSIDTDYEFEKNELAEIYQSRGLTHDLSHEVAEQLMAHDALGAHARDEIGLTDIGQARPIEAALSSAATFSIGAIPPLLVTWLSPTEHVITLVAVTSLLFLASLGAISAKAGGASITTAVSRVTFWGALAMLATAIIGHLFGVAV